MQQAPARKEEAQRQMKHRRLQPGTAATSNMASHIPTMPSVVLTDVEADVLALFDQLQQLQLELALLRSQQSHASGPYPHMKPVVCCGLTVDTDNPSEAGASVPAEHDLAGDQTQLLEAKATLALRNSVVESVVAVQPTLKAVHRATHASPVEGYVQLYLLHSLCSADGWGLKGTYYQTLSSAMPLPSKQPQCAQICRRRQVVWQSLQLRVSLSATETSSWLRKHCNSLGKPMTKNRRVSRAGGLRER